MVAAATGSESGGVGRRRRGRQRRSWWQCSAAGRRPGGRRRLGQPRGSASSSSSPRRVAARGRRRRVVCGVGCGRRCRACAAVILHLALVKIRPGGGYQRHGQRLGWRRGECQLSSWRSCLQRWGWCFRGSGDLLHRRDAVQAVRSESCWAAACGCLQLDRSLAAAVEGGARTAAARLYAWPVQGKLCSHARMLARARASHICSLLAMRSLASIRVKCFARSLSHFSLRLLAWL